MTVFNSRSEQGYNYCYNEHRNFYKQLSNLLFDIIVRELSSVAMVSKSSLPINDIYLV